MKKRPRQKIIPSQAVANLQRRAAPVSLWIEGKERVTKAAKSNEIDSSEGDLSHGNALTSGNQQAARAAFRAVKAMMNAAEKREINDPRPCASPRSMQTGCPMRDGAA